MVQKSGGGPAPFLTKTYEMVEDERTNDVISWGAKGTSFVVWKPVEFARDLLPIHFKHCNFSSFVRQLNTYGFRKVVPDRWEFANDKFRRGEQMLLADIRRRKTVSNTRNQSNINACQFPSSSILNSAEMHSTSSTSSPALPPPSPPVSDNILELTNENEMLRKDNQSLSIELEHAKRHYDELLGFLSNFVDVSKLNFDGLVQENTTTICIKEQGSDCRMKGKQKEVVDESVDKEKGLKIFGVLLKGFEGEEIANNGGKKRRYENKNIEGRPNKMSFGLPWIGVPTSL